MKKRFKTRSAILLAAISLVLQATLSPADMIVLKDGQNIEVEKASEQEGNIFFYLHGLKMRVSKKAVLRVTKTNNAEPASPAEIKGSTAEDKNRSTRRVRVEKIIEAGSLSVETPAGEQREKKQLEIRWSGFRDLNWAIGRSTLGRLTEVESGTGREEIKEYVRANEDLKMGKARLDSIVYAFWRHKLYAVTIRAAGHPNYLALRNEVFNRFGIGHKSDQNRELYLWSDSYSDRMLKYVDADQSGLFWMRSKELNRMHQLPQIKTPSASSKSMETKALRTN
jgi:hypothetical protein